MPDITISHNAREDLLDIGRYSEAQWGAAQRRDYLAEFGGLFDRLASGHIRGRARDDLRPGLISQPLGRHMVFFRRAPSGDVEILRVLHQSQDHDRHL